MHVVATVPPLQLLLLMVSINEVKDVQIDTDLDDVNITRMQPTRKGTAGYSTISSDVDNTLYLQSSRRLFLLRWTPSNHKIKPC